VAFAASNVGTYSAVYCGIALVMSLVFSYLYARYHALASVMIAQSLFVVLYILVLPALHH